MANLTLTVPAEGEHDLEVEALPEQERFVSADGAHEFEFGGRTFLMSPFFSTYESRLLEDLPEEGEDRHGLLSLPKKDWASPHGS